MEAETMDAIRVLADFAESHAEDVYLEGIDDEAELVDARINFDALLDAARIALAYLDAE